MNYLRSFLFNILYVTWTTGIAIVLAPLLVAPRWLVQRGAHVWTAGLFLLMRWIIGLKFEVRGWENIPQGAVILASKHQSAWETFIFHQLFKDPIFILKKELLYIPFVGWQMWRSGAVGVDRSKGTAALKKMIEEAKVRVEEKSSIVIFPEGTRTPVGSHNELHPGVAMLYDHLKVPVVPVALNSGYFWGRREFLKKSGTVVIEFLEPMPADMKKRDFLKELHRRLNDSSDRLLEEAGMDIKALHASALLGDEA